jgi:hypothetical protein
MQAVFLQQSVEEKRQTLILSYKVSHRHHYYSAADYDDEDL